MGQTKRQFKKEVMFNNSTLESLRTIDFVKEKVYDHIVNKYSVRVVDASGADIPGTVSGTVTFLAFSDGSDRAQSPKQDIDLSTNDRNFTPFYDYTGKVIFSVSGLTAGARVIATCIRTDA